MKINVIATGSTGNCYELIDNSGNSIIIEAGIPRQQFVKFREGLTPPEMCIITHMHGDHAQYIGEYRAVMPVYVSEPKIESKNFKVMGFSMLHGGVVCYSYLIKLLSDNKFIFFGTDFEFSEDYFTLFRALKFYDVENYLIECNYNDYLYHLADQLQRTGCDRHMSDNDVINFMKLSGAKSPKMILIHGSNRLSADTYTKKYISAKVQNSTVQIATGVKGGQKNIFII